MGTNKLAVQQKIAYIAILMLTLFLAYSEFFKNLSIAIMLSYLTLQLVNNKLFLTKDMVNISLTSYLFVVFLGAWFGINPNESFSQSSDIVKIVIVFLFFREVKLDFISLETIVRFLLIGFVGAVSIAMVDYYIFGSDYLKLHSVGSINRSAVYIMYIFVLAIVLQTYFQSKLTKALLLFGVVFSIIALIAGGSRMAMFSIPVILGFYLLLQRKCGIREYLLLTVPIILIIFIIFLYPDSRVSSRFDQGFNDPARIQIWMSSIYAWLEHNIFLGIGVGNSIFIDVKDYFEHPVTRNIDNTHQLYLDLLLEKGVFGFVAFFTFLYSLFVFDVSKERLMLIRLLILSLLLMGFTNITFRYEFAILFVTIIGSLINTSIRKES